MRAAGGLRADSERAAAELGLYARSRAYRFIKRKQVTE